MNPIIFALRHPITVMVGVAAIFVSSALALVRMNVDIFPTLNLPVIYVAQPYGGMDPAQMEGLITNYYEYHFLYITGIHHVESKNIQGVALMKLFFHPGTNMAQAMAETINYVNRSQAFMPPGTVPPFIMRFDTGSVPVGHLVFSSETRSLGEINDLALFRVRPMFASLPGVSAPPPFGGNQRTLVINVDPHRLRSFDLTPEDVVQALARGNTISPSGVIRTPESMPMVPINAMVKSLRELESIPLRPDGNLFVRDVATVEDSTDIPTGYALVKGGRAVYILVNKRADASTLAVVNAVRANLPRMQSAIPDDIRVSFEFDQSPFVTRSMWGVGIEALLGAILTGLMVLLFLRDWRSVIVVVLNIPLALLSALIGLWLCGETINLMTLGGLSLAVGILVDESTVEVENIHTQMKVTDSIARAVRLGNAETAVPRFLAMLCILAVFVSSFFMQGAPRALFVPLSLAVGFSMVASYVLSSTFVPVLSVWLLRHFHEHESPDSFFARLKSRYVRMTRRLIGMRGWLVPAYFGGAILAVILAGSQVGTEIFPNVDTGQFQLRMRAPVGTRIERTEFLLKEALGAIRDEVGEDNVAMSVGYVGVVPPSYPINNIYLWTSGPEEAVVRVALKPESRMPVAELQEKLRQSIPRRLLAWQEQQLLSRGRDSDAARDEAERLLAGLTLSFEPADIVNEVMSFGSPTRIEVAVSGGKKFGDTVAFARRLKSSLEAISSLRDLQFGQSLAYPTLDIKIDREKAARSGVTVKHVTDAVVAATSSSRFVVPVFWADPKTGIGYQVQVQVPITRMDTARRVQLVPVKKTADGTLLVQDVARVRESTMPGEYDRYNMRRTISMTANIEGEDLGRVADRIDEALAAGGALPADVKIDVRGQVAPMREIFGGLGGGPIFGGLTGGLVMAIVVIALLLTAYFQSFRLALLVIVTVPAIFAGSAVALLLTGTTLNIQSFMGTIMAMGVGVANSILLLTFAEKSRLDGNSAAEAAVDGARHRLRPILMTTCAMLAGMIPMALGLGEGGQQVAPLARAVIGGLLAATVTTLLMLPSLFALSARLALVPGGVKGRSVSLDPDDPESTYFEGQS
jgi:multidrug efflux pump subunit AcrB